MDSKRIAVIVVAVLLLGYLGYRISQVPPSPAVTASPIVSSNPTTIPTASASWNALAVLAVINDRRAAAGSDALEINGILQYEAQAHATDMATRNYFSHDTPEGTTFQQRMAASGYPSTILAENIGLSTSGQASDVVDIWMNSVAHRTNVLDIRFRAAGVGVAPGTYQNQPAIYVVVIFGDIR
jgi:uncharacterized protein YkwD